MNTLDNLYGPGWQPMIRYKFNYNNTRILFAAEKPNSQYIDSQGELLDNNSASGGDGQSSLPDFVVNVKQSFDRGFFTVSAVGRQLGVKVLSDSYTNTTNTYSNKALGWGLGASLNFKFYGKNAFFIQAAGGRGIGQYIDDLENQDFYLEVPANNQAGSFNMRVLTATNITGGFELWATEKLNFNVSASVTKINTPRTTTSVPTFNTNQQRYLVNAIYQVSKTVKFGAEILHYKRRAGTTVRYNGKDTRFLTSFIYKF
jgi:hypothetical protein